MNREYIGVLIGVIIGTIGGYNAGKNKYQYFEREDYVVRYHAGSNVACVIPENKVAAKEITESGYMVCEYPWASRVLGLAPDYAD